MTKGLMSHLPCPVCDAADEGEAEGCLARKRKGCALTAYENSVRPASVVDRQLAALAADRAELRDVRHALVRVATALLTLECELEDGARPLREQRQTLMNIRNSLAAVDPRLQQLAEKE